MLNRMHRYTAIILTIYALFHVVNHLIGYYGAEAHIAYMQSLREVYLYALVEVGLMASIGVQASTGFYFVLRRWSARHSFFDYLQAFSGLYLAVFMISHVAMVMNARMSYGLDTNFYFAAAGINVEGLKGYLFTTYYFLAVAAIFTHLSAAARWWFIFINLRPYANAAAAVIILVGLCVSSFIVAIYSGAFYDLNIPAIYFQAYS